MTRTRGYTAAMTKRLALISLLSCLLAACGNKGPLVLPEQPAPAAAPAAEAPAETPAAPAAPTAPAVEPPANSYAGTPASQP